MTKFNTEKERRAYKLGYQKGYRTGRRPLKQFFSEWEASLKEDPTPVQVAFLEEVERGIRRTASDRRLVDHSRLRNTH